jgi:predicted protein tyrosine phosphatase
MKDSHARPLKLLFVCSRNFRRSLTAERLLDGVTGYEARSAGTQPGARVALTAGLIGWADIIFFMERSHLNRARERFGEELQDSTCHVLNVPDDYEFMQEELVDELRVSLGDWVPLPEGK